MVGGELLTLLLRFFRDLIPELHVAQGLIVETDPGLLGIIFGLIRSGGEL